MKVLFRRMFDTQFKTGKLKDDKLEMDDVTNPKYKIVPLEEMRSVTIIPITPTVQALFDELNDIDTEINKVIEPLYSRRRIIISKLMDYAINVKEYLKNLPK